MLSVFQKHYWSETLVITLTGARAIIKLSGHHHQWLVDGHDLEIGHFRGG